MERSIALAVAIRLNCSIKQSVQCGVIKVLNWLAPQQGIVMVQENGIMQKTPASVSFSLDVNH